MRLSKKTILILLLIFSFSILILGTLLISIHYIPEVELTNIPPPSISTPVPSLQPENTVSAWLSPKVHWQIETISGKIVYYKKDAPYLTLVIEKDSPNEIKIQSYRVHMNTGEIVNQIITQRYKKGIFRRFNNRIYFSGKSGLEYLDLDDQDYQIMATGYFAPPPQPYYQESPYLITLYSTSAYGGFDSIRIFDLNQEVFIKEIPFENQDMVFSEHYLVLLGGDDFVPPQILDLTHNEYLRFPHEEQNILVDVDKLLSIQNNILVYSNNQGVFAYNISDLEEKEMVQNTQGINRISIQAVYDHVIHLSLITGDSPVRYIYSLGLSPVAVLGRLELPSSFLLSDQQQLCYKKDDMVYHLDLNTLSPEPKPLFQNEIDYKLLSRRNHLSFIERFNNSIQQNIMIYQQETLEPILNITMEHPDNQRIDPNRFSMDVNEDYIYFTTASVRSINSSSPSNAALICCNKNTQSIQWKWTSPAAQVLGNLYLKEDLVLCGDDAGFLWAFDQSSGEERWRLHIQQDINNTIQTAYPPIECIFVNQDLILVSYHAQLVLITTSDLIRQSVL